MKYESTCEFCGENFQSSRTNAKYCSANCRVKYHQSKKKQEETTVQEQPSAQQEAYNSQRIQLEQQRAKLIRHNEFLLDKAMEAKKKKHHCNKMIQKIELEIKFTDLQIKEDVDKQQRLGESLQSKRKKEEQLQKEADRRKVGIERLTIIGEIKKIEKEIASIENEIEALYPKISGQKRKLIRLNADLDKWKGRLNRMKTNFDKCRNTRHNNRLEIEAITNRLNNPQPVQQHTTPSQPPASKHIIVKPASSNKGGIGAGDLQHINFPTFRLPGELGRFLGELDRNKTCFALTGDSGAGKSWFSFEIVRLFIAEMGFRVKYFSLEEGLGKLTQEKVAAFGLGNELNLTGTGSLEDVRKAAKDYPIVVVDSFTSLGEKAEEFERLRTDFPNTIFLLIFQKTTAGTMRGGAAIKYNSSATINVTKRNGQRIAIMEKGRYGTIGWEYSITQKQVIKTDETY